MAHTNIMKTVTVTYSAEFTDTIEVPDDWEHNGSLTQLLEHTDMPYDNGALIEWRAG